MHRVLIAAAAAATLTAGAAAHAGDWSQYSEWSPAQPCGCQGYGYDQSGDWNYGYEGNYDIPFLPSESYGYGSSYEHRSYGYAGYGGYDRGYDYDRSYGAAPGYGHYTQSYDYDHDYQPRRYSYRRSYHYAEPRYPTYHYRYHPRYYGHSSRDGERG